MVTRCSHCGEQLDWRAGVVEEVTGWVEYRGATGGAHAVSDKRPTGRAVHAGCFDAFRQVERGQAALI